MKTLAFKSAEEFRAWLADNHHEIEGIWLRIYKKDSGKKTVAYAEALDHALCFGWIDGRRRRSTNTPGFRGSRRVAPEADGRR